jgi:CRISPR-associated protein (TIGR02584 family)
MKTAKSKTPRSAAQNPQRIAPDKKSPLGGATLLAVVGVSPAILTETVWALAQRGQRTPPVIPDDVVAITTLKGQKTIAEQLQTPAPDFGGRTVWNVLREELLGPEGVHHERLILKVIVIERPDPATGGTVPLEDIRDREENLAAAEFILKQVRHYTDAKDRQLIASLAGGRKTMSALLHAAFSHLGRPQDRLTHILVNEPFDSGLRPLFFYPSQPAQRLTGREGKTYHARQARLELADVPFAPMRLRFPDVADIPTRFRDLVQTYLETFKRDASKPVLIELLQDPPRVVVDGLSVELESERQLSVISFLLQANQKAWLHKSQYEAVALFKAFHGYQPNADELKSVRPSLRDTVGKLTAQKSGSRGPQWIAGATNEDIKRPLSYLRMALKRAGSSWELPKRDLRLPAFRLAGQA